jgi:hypothetical protein
MSFAAVAPNSELGKVISKDDMKVDRYLDDLLPHLRSAAEDNKSQPALKFSMILVMLKTWYHKKCGKGGHPGCPKAGLLPRSPDGGRQASAERRYDSAGNVSNGDGSIQGLLNQPTPTQGLGAEANPERSEYNNPNTPLQLLSEVAMGNQSGIPLTGTQRNMNSDGSAAPRANRFDNYSWLNINMEGTPAPPTGSYLPPMTPASGTTGQSGNSPAGVSQYGMEGQYQPGGGFEGFEQGMDFAFGENGIDFVDDGFFNTLMDGMNTVLGDSWGE